MPALYNTTAALLIVLGLASTVNSESLRERLDQQTDYHVHAVAPDEQLIEVARHFQIPMAIEWLDQAAPEGRAHKLQFTAGRVIDLINAIVAVAPDQVVRVEDRFVRIFPPKASDSRLNFLNFRLNSFCVWRESVLGADFRLRIDLDETFYPEHFKYGYNGGYGGGEWLLLIDQLTICLNKPSIRDVLNEIVGQSGRAAWVVSLKPEELQGKMPFWKHAPKSESADSPFTGRWFFVELREYN